MTTKDGIRLAALPRILAPSSFTSLEPDERREIRAEERMLAACARFLEDPELDEMLMSWFMELSDDGTLIRHLKNLKRAATRAIEEE